MSNVVRPTPFNALEDFRRWENRFDVSLKTPSPRLAWKRLTRAGCEPDAMKSALYWAAYSLRGAYEWPEEFAAFSQARTVALQRLLELQKILRALMTPAVNGNSVMSWLFFIYGVANNHSRFFRTFPKMVERAENILSFADPLETPKHTNTDYEIACGEVLLHTYVKETTGKFFDEEVAVLFEVGAESYLMKRMPSYNTSAVIKRYRRWFRDRKQSDYRELRGLVKEIKRDRDEFLTKFLEHQMIMGSLFLNARSLLSVLGENDDRTIRASEIGDTLALLRGDPSIMRFSSRKSS